MTNGKIRQFAWGDCASYAWAELSLGLVQAVSRGQGSEVEIVK